MLLAIGLSVWSALEQRRAMIVEMDSASRSMALVIDREVQVTASILRALAASRAVDEAVGAGPGGAAARLAPLHAQARSIIGDSDRTLHNIVLHDAASGRQIVNTLQPPGTPLPGIAASAAPAARSPEDPGSQVEGVFRELVGNGMLHVTDVYLGAVAQEYLVGVMLPVERAGRVVAVLSANIRPAKLGEVLRAQIPDTGYVAALVDRGGLILARSLDEERFLGKPASEDVQRFLAEGVDAATRRSLTADGTEVYGSFRRLSTAPWTLAYGAPRAVVDAPIRRLVVIMGGAGSLALALFVAVALGQGRRLSRELATLAGDAARIGRGEPLPDQRDRIREVAEVRAALRAGVGSLAAAEERMRLAIDASGLATWEIDTAAGNVVWAGHFPDMLGLPTDHAGGTIPLSAWLDCIHPDDLPAVRAEWAKSSREGTRFHAIYRIRRADDGSVRWLESFGSRVRDGAIDRSIGLTLDVTERHVADEHRRLLMQEVDHRAKNALAVVHSVVRLTRASDAPSFAAAVEGRVRALARAHDLLARDRWKGASLAALAGEELAAQIAAGQVTLDGPEVQVAPAAVQPLAMVLHELATNAAKHGALGAAEGRARLVWERDDAGLRLCWSETGGPPVEPPAHSGFGTRLIGATVEDQLGGRVRFDWRPLGLHCEIAVPEDRLAPVAAGAGGAAPEPPVADAAATAGLVGRRVVVIEDEAAIAQALVDMLRGAGCVPLGPAASLQRAEELVAGAAAVDAAILDASLGGESALPLARRLMARGLPVVVVTGYGDLPPAWLGEDGLSAILRKPVDPDALVAALGHALAGPRSGGPRARRA